MDQGNFFSELKRRNVYKVAVAYAVVGWLFIQVATQVFPFFEIPNWAVRLVVLAIVVGFPIALVMAWAFEVTPEGIKRTEDVGPTGERPAKSRAWIYVVVIGAALSLGLFLLGRYSASAPAAAGRGEKSIAVLPFVNQSGDPAQEYFSDGLTEELINVLGQVRELRVIGRNSSFRFKGKTENSRAIGEALRVANVLEGSVRKSGDRVRISIQLVDAATDSQRWSQTYDRELEDVFAVQEEIARSVGEQLRVTLVGDAGNGLARPSNENLDAYKAYLQAQFYFGQRNDEATTKAITLLQEALRLDPKYAEAHFLMSRALSAAASTKGVSGRAKFEQARQSAITAAALKPDLAGARAALAYFDVIIDCNLAAENELSRLPPKDPTVLAVRAIARTAAGDVEQAVALQRKVIDSDPVFAQWHINLAGNLLRLRQYDEAESALRRALELQPRAQSAHADLALLAVLRGQGDIALREAELEPVGFRRAESIAFAQHARGDGAAADGALQSFIATYGADFPLEVGIIYAARGEADKAFEWLNQAYAAHEPFFFRIGVNPFLKAYYSDPRFVELCRKANLPLPQ